MNCLVLTFIDDSQYQLRNRQAITSPTEFDQPEFGWQKMAGRKAETKMSQFFAQVREITSEQNS